jgi:hypothetical protein
MSNRASNSGRVLSVTVSDDEAGEARHHFNIDNVSFISSVEKAPTTAGWIVAGLLAIGAGWLVLDVLGNTLLALAGGIIAGVVAVGLMSAGRHEIGTIAETHEIDESELRSGSGIESQLFQLEADVITVDDIDRHLLYTIEYRHLFLPQNIVSIKETSAAPLIAILLLAVVLPIELIYGGLELGLPIFLGITLPSGAMPGLDHFLITAAYVLGIVGPTIYALTRMNEYKLLEINTPADTNHSFELTQADASRVLRGLESREPEQVAADTRRS